MQKAALVAAALVVFAATARFSAQAPPQARDLVGTWTLAAMQQGIDGGKPTAVQNVRGLLVFDAGGHAIEVLVRPDNLAGGRGASPLTRFQGFGGSWGDYRADVAARTITFAPRGAVSPNLQGTEFTRSFERAGNTLTITSHRGELHTQGITRWIWERVPTVDHLSDGYRKVIGFWLHVVERRVNTATGEVFTEAKRAPSVIVYTPSGYVGVHFPPLDRQAFAAGEPTEAEARAALQGYVGYFGALGVYPGMVFHQILAGLSPTAGNTLKRSFELKGDELHVSFAPLGSQPGQQQRTTVTLRRLSGEREMLGR